MSIVKLFLFRKAEWRAGINGQRFVRPEFQLLLALYAVHFAVWIPIAMRLSPPMALAKLLIVMAPLVVCYGMPASWIGASHAIWGRDRLTDPSLGFLPTGHLCLLAFTLLCFVTRVIGIGF